MRDNDNPERVKRDFTRDVSRRRMMRLGSGLAVFGIAAPAEGTFDAEDFAVTPIQDLDDVEVEEQGLEYFTMQQARVVHDLTARIYPSDDNGPGAPEAGVVYFIDDQLNSAWGRGERWYMEGPFAGEDPTDPFEDDAEDPADIDDETNVPWAETTPAQTQGWQYPLAPNEAYDRGIYAVEQHVQAEYDEDSFADLEDEQQDEIVAALEEDEVDAFDDIGIDAEGFFLMVRQNTLEGMFSDPMHGGNREMIGWRLKGFPGTPGALGSYRGMIESEEELEFIELEEGDYRKLADDVDSLGIDGDNPEPANEQGEGHAHVHDAAEADYPNVVDEDAARGDLEREIEPMSENPNAESIADGDADDGGDDDADDGGDG